MAHIADIATYAQQHIGSDPAHQPLYPGTLAAHPDLVDVLLEWRSL